MLKINKSYCPSSARRGDGAQATLASEDCATLTRCFFYFFFLRGGWGDAKVLSHFNTPKLILCIFLSLLNPPLSLRRTPPPSPAAISPFTGSADRPCYLPNIVRQRSGIFYWLKIKVAKSPPRSPPLLLAALKNRGKHQFLAHQWRLHNQLKKTLVWGCKSYLCLIRAFRRCMSGFNVMK